MTLKNIRLELARSKEFPDGSADHGYLLKAPLLADGHLDAVAWKAERDLCTVRRFWGGAEEELGRRHRLHFSQQVLVDGFEAFGGLLRRKLEGVC